MGRHRRGPHRLRRTRTSELDALWKQVLLHQFHDILPGTSIAWVHREAVAQYARVTRGHEAIIAAALAALVGEGERPIAVNAAPFTRSGVRTGAGVRGGRAGRRSPTP